MVRQLLCLKSVLKSPKLNENKKKSLQSIPKLPLTSKCAQFEDTSNNLHIFNTKTYIKFLLDINRSKTETYRKYL